MRKKINLKQNVEFPKKDKSYLMLIPSDNPTFMFEVYDYRGIFVGFMGEKKIYENSIDGKTETNKEN